MQADERKDYCVYVHLDNEDNIRYIGKGTIARANLTHAKSNRNKEYEKYVNKFGKLKVEILYSGLAEDEAFALELDLYLKYKDSSHLLNSRSPVRPYDYPSKSELKNIIYYDETSVTCLRWKSDIISGNGAVKINKDSEAGCFDKNKGYCRVKIKGRIMYAHRLIYILHYDNLSSSEVIDHIDGNPRNNKINNLRSCSKSENSRNMKIADKNKFGVGITLNNSKTAFRCRWVDMNRLTNNGVPTVKEKHFNISKFGYDEALQLAREYRALKILEIYGDEFTHR